MAVETEAETDFPKAGIDELTGYYLGCLEAEIVAFFDIVFEPEVVLVVGKMPVNLVEDVKLVVSAGMNPFLRDLFISIFLPLSYSPSNSSTALSAYFDVLYKIQAFPLRKLVLWSTQVRKTTISPYYPNISIAFDSG